jgi:hypothetical protein
VDGELRTSQRNWTEYPAATYCGKEMVSVWMKMLNRSQDRMLSKISVVTRWIRTERGSEVLKGVLICPSNGL